MRELSKNGRWQQDNLIDEKVITATIYCCWGVVSRLSFMREIGFMAKVIICWANSYETSDWYRP
jgi:hypothetical protein